MLLIDERENAIATHRMKNGNSAKNYFLLQLHFDLTLKQIDFDLRSLINRFKKNSRCVGAAAMLNKAPELNTPYEYVEQK